LDVDDPDGMVTSGQSGGFRKMQADLQLHWNYFLEITGKQQNLKWWVRRRHDRFVFFRQRHYTINFARLFYRSILIENQ